MIFYVSFMVTTKEKPVTDTQRIVTKKSKRIATKTYQITKDNRIKEAINKGSTKQPEKNEQNRNSKSLYINNYSKSKWIDLPNQKPQNGWMN